MINNTDKAIKETLYNKSKNLKTKFIIRRILWKNTNLQQELY